MESLPNEPTLKANLIRAYKSLVPGNNNSRNKFIKVYGQYYRRFAGSSRQKMPLGTFRTASAIAKDLSNQYNRAQSNQNKLRLGTNIRTLGYTPSEISPVQAVGKPAQVSPEEQIIQNLETAKSLNEAQFIKAWNKYTKSINPNPYLRFRLRDVYTKADKLRTNRVIRYSYRQRQMAGNPSGPQEDNKLELDQLRQNILKLGGTVPGPAGFGGGEQAPKRNKQKQKFIWPSFPSLGQPKPEQLREPIQKIKFNFLHTSVPNFNTFINDYQKYKADPSRFESFNKRQLVNMLEQFKRTKMGEYYAMPNGEQKQILAGKLANIGVSKNSLNKTIRLKKRELALAALATAIQPAEPNVAAVLQAYQAYLPSAQTGNFMRFNVRKAKSIINKQNSWSKKVKDMFNESMTSPTRQISQLEKSLAEQTNETQKKMIRNKIQAIRNAARTPARRFFSNKQKALGNARRRALASLRTTGKGLATVVASPVIAAGGLVSSGYKGARQRALLAKEDYASYAEKRKHRAEMIEQARKNVLGNLSNPIIETYPENKNYRNAYNKFKKERIHRQAINYVSTGQKPPKGINQAILNEYERIMGSVGRKFGRGTKSAGMAFGRGAKSAGMAFGRGVQGAGTKIDEMYKASRDLREQKRKNYNHAKRLVNSDAKLPENASDYLRAIYGKLRAIKAKQLAQEYINKGINPAKGSRGINHNVKEAYAKLIKEKKIRNARKAALASGVKYVGSGLGSAAKASARLVYGGFKGLEKTGSYIKKMKSKSMQNYENEISNLNIRLKNINEQLGNENIKNDNKRNLIRSRKGVSEKRDEIKRLLRRLQLSKTGDIRMIGKIYQRTQEFEAQKAGLQSNIEKVERELANPTVPLSPANQNRLEKRQREIKVRMTQLNRLIAKRNAPKPSPTFFGAIHQAVTRPTAAPMPSRLAPALSSRSVPVNRMTNFSLKYEETTDERTKAQIIQQAYKLALENMKKARTDTDLEEMYAQYRTLGPDSRRFKDLLDMGYKTIKSRKKSRQENRGNIGKLFGSGNLGKLMGSESTKKLFQELPSYQREVVKNAGGLTRASSLINNAGGPSVVTRAAEVLKKTGGNAERAALTTPSIPVRAFQNVKKLGGPSTAVRTVRVVQVIKTRARRRKTTVKKPSRVTTRKPKKKKKSLGSLKKIVHKLPRRNLEREALKWLSR